MLLSSDRPIIWFDTETTGPNAYQDRIVELGFVMILPDGSVGREWCAYVNPGIPIPPEATYGNAEKGFEGHGITDEMVKDAPAFKEWAPHLLRGFTGDVAYGGFNVKTFDLPLLRAEFERAGHLWSFANNPIIDGYRLWQLGTPRSLSDAVARFLNRKHEGAHRATDDVKASIEVVMAQLQEFTQLPRDLAALDALQWPRDPNAITPDGKVIWRDGVAVFNFGKKFRGLRLDLCPRRDLEWLAYTSDMSPEVKQVCMDALNGKFPTRETETSV